MPTSTLPQIPGYTDTQVRELAESRLKTLVSRHRKHVRWQQMAADYSAGRRADLNLRAMPSKQLKHWMYDDAYSVQRLLGLDVPRAQDLDGIAVIINAAKAALR